MVCKLETFEAAVYNIFQEELYGLILETNEECLRLCKPGTSIREIHNYSVKLELIQLGLSDFLGSFYWLIL